MDLKRKIEIATQAVDNIAKHDDADFAVRTAALQAVVDFAEVAKREAAERVQDSIRKALAKD